MSPEPGPSPPTIHQVKPLLPEEYSEDDIRITRREGGTNNRCFEVRADVEAYFLKQYFSHPEDDRPRLRTEFEFTRFLERRGVARIPTPIARDPENNLGLYSYLEGTQPDADELTEGRVLELADFLAEINQHRSHPEARTLPDASGSCFSLEQHVESVQQRLDAFGFHPPRSRLHERAATFFKNVLLPKWENVRERIRREVNRRDLDWDRVLPDRERCLSPSDFGFHNVILGTDDTLRVHDFEYAGWDDPAKAVADCFTQPEYPLNHEHVEPFVDRVSRSLQNADTLHERARLLLPVHTVKWCGILLNDFRPVGNRRRSFARGEQQSEEQQLRTQLNKAESYVRSHLRIDNGPGGG